MIRVGILSDTHGYVHPRVPEFFSTVDEIWHAGDMGDIRTVNQLRKLKPLRGVFGNVDGRDIRMEFQDVLEFRIEGIPVLMTHIGGYPGRYDPRVRLLIESERPKLFVCGHSHILKVMYDHRFELLHINPGAAGRYGIHKSITAVRLEIDGTNMQNLEVLDILR
jgi:hypothetical protein